MDARRDPLGGYRLPLLNNSLRPLILLHSLDQVPELPRPLGLTKNETIEQLTIAMAEYTKIFTPIDRVLASVVAWMLRVNPPACRTFESVYILEKLSKILPGLTRSQQARP